MIQVRVEPGDGAEPAKKPRIDKQDSHSSPVAFQTKDIPIPDFPDNDETNADDFAMEMGLACVVCRWVMMWQLTVTAGLGLKRDWAISYCDLDQNI